MTRGGHLGKMGRDAQGGDAGPYPGDVHRRPEDTSYSYYLAEAEAAARALAMELVPAGIEGVSDLESSIEALARVPGGALIVMPDLTTAAHGDVIVALAARHRLPASMPSATSSRGLMSYGTDRVAETREAASYLDRILRGAAPGDLPVQTPTKFETAVNLKTAKAWTGRCRRPSCLAPTR